MRPMPLTDRVNRSFLVRVRQPRRARQPGPHDEPRHPRGHRQARHPPGRSGLRARPDALVPAEPGRLRSRKYHAQLAIDSGCNAYAAPPLGALEFVAGPLRRPDPLILKLNNSDTMAKMDQPISAVTGSVKDAVRLGCAAIGYTIYPGSGQRNCMYEDLASSSSRRRAPACPTVLWALPARRRHLEGTRAGRRHHRVCGAGLGADGRPRHQRSSRRRITSSRPRRRRSSRSTTSRPRPRGLREALRAERIQRQAHRHLLGRRGEGHTGRARGDPRSRKAAPSAPSWAATPSSARVPRPSSSLQDVMAIQERRLIGFPKATMTVTVSAVAAMQSCGQHHA